MSRVWRDDEVDDRPVWPMLIFPILFILGCIMEVWLG